MENGFSQMPEVKKYIDYISGGKRSVLSVEQEALEFEKARRGDAEATGAVIKSNMGLLYVALKRYDAYASSAGVSLCDVASDILTELIEKRLHSFDFSYGRRVGSYLFDQDFLGHRIGRLINEYRLYGMKKVPGRNPVSVLPFSGGNLKDNSSNEEIVGFLRVAEAQKDVPSIADFAMHKFDYEKLVEVVAMLPEREQYIIEQFYFHNRSDVDIGRDLGLSRNRVHQLQSKAVKKLRIKLSKDVKMERPNIFQNL